jgi:hypothetical protein
MGGGALPLTGDFFPRTGYPVVKGTAFHDKQAFLKRVVVSRDPITIDIPVAFNDPIGVYDISITELFTNKTVIKRLIVQ